MQKGEINQGKWGEGAGDWFETTDPATGETTWSGQAGSAEQVNAAVNTARIAQADWAMRPQAERTSILERYAEEITKRRATLADAISRDMGNTDWDAKAEAGAMATPRRYGGVWPV